MATTNRHKLDEFAAMLAAWRVQVEPLPDGLPPCPEHGQSFEANAVEKAVYYAALVNGWVMADDSGLTVDALGGRPGVMSARYAGEHGNDAANNAKLLAELAGVPPEQRTARYVCAVALWHGGLGRGYVARGELVGRIAEAPAGSHGFGYDPLFYLPARGKTVAELDPAEKHEISHRRRALERAITLWQRGEGC